VLGDDRRQAVPGRRRGSALATGRACRGLVRVSGCGPWCSVTGSSSGSSFSRLVKPAERRRRRQCRAVLGDDRRQAVPGRRRGSALAADRACRGLVRISGCGQQGERRAVLGGDRRQAVPGRRRGSALAADRACRGLVRISGCGQQGERRAVLGGDRRQAVPGRRRGSALAADRACCGLVRISGCGQAAVAAGVVSVGQCSVAIGWQAVPGRRRGSALAAGRACCGLVRVSGCWPWCSVTGSSSGSSFSRLVKPAERRRRRQCRAVLGGDRPASGARSNARQRTPKYRKIWYCKCARSNARQRTGGRSGLLWPGQGLGLRAGSGCRWRGQCRAVLGGDRPASGARSKTRQRTGGRSGLPWSAGQALGLRSARRASGSAWWRSPASGARPKTRQRTGGRSGLLWPGQDLGLRSARRASGGAWWRSAGKRCQAEDEAAHWRPVGLAVAWSGCRVTGRGAQSPAVHPGLRSLDW
jgi:hypothetical protein